MDFVCKRFEQLSAEELYEILKVRFHVFVMEQHCFYLDMDNTDYVATHIFFWDSTHSETTEQGDNRMPVVAYARLYKDRDGTTWHIGRMLTLVRGVGMGKQLMLRAIDLLRQTGAGVVVIDAQQYAIRFYEKLGFAVTSDPFDEAGITHVKMTLNL
ncbi:MAG: GNAT family N-acetyltransferase [Paludibacteraceae bacterium]|nr:GNAT family N-acetyltransferase [Paludibacteraceae bacterium]